MGKHLILFIGLALLTSGCTASMDQESAFENGGIYKTPNFFVSAPSGFTYSEFAPSKDYYYFGYSNSDSSGIKIIEIHDSLSCPPLGIDSPQSMIVGDDTALWGRVDYYDVNRAYDIFSEQPFCIPPVINDDFCGEAGVFTEQQKREYQECIRKREERKRSPSGAYAFCAEKQGKAVAICIRQQTDNPQLAEDIFKTFRWTN